MRLNRFKKGGVKHEKKRGGVIIMPRSTSIDQRIAAVRRIICINQRKIKKHFARCATKCYFTCYYKPKIPLTINKPKIMKKITFLIVMLCFWMGHSQVAQRATPTLSQADSRVAAQTAPTQQTTSGNSSLLAVSTERGVASSPYTVGRAQSESTQAARVASTNAPGSISLYAAENNLEGAPFTVASRTQEIAPVSNAACSFDNPSNAWENGYNYTGAFGELANDFEVPAGTTFDFDQITYNSFISPGENITGVDVAIYADAGGFPGVTAIASFAAVVPTSTTLIGGNFGFDGIEVVLDMPPVTLEAGVYWVGLNNGTTNGGGPLFWEVTSATMEGSPSAQGGAYPDPTIDGVYSFSGDCSTGNAGPCAYDNPSNAWENGYNYTGAFGELANDFEVPAGTTFDFDQITYNSFISPGENITGVDVAIYADAGGFPGVTAIASFAAVVPTSTTLIGGNFGFDGIEVVLDMPPVTLEAGVYWVGLNNGTTNGGGPLFWEVTSATMEGSPSAQGGAYPDPTIDGVYSFSGTCSSGSNALVINFDPAAAYIGYANVFETPANGGGFVFGSPWGVSDLKTVVDPTATVTLQPNFNTYDDNPTDPFWVDQATGLGNKDFEGNTYVDDPSLAGQELVWTGFVQVNDLDPSYAAEAFIKVFNADFSVLKIETAPLVAGEYFEVAYTNVEAPDTFVQYGWYVKGLNASSANEVALGTIVIGTGPAFCGDFAYINEAPTGSGPPSQIFPDFPDFTSISVDDLFITGDAGLICSIDIQGRYTAGAPGLPGDPNSTVELTIYADDNGIPGAVQYTESFPGSVDADADGNFTLEPAQVIEATINPDTRYWISVVAVMEFGLSGQWYWSSATDANDNAALWQNPGGGFGVCPSWATFAECGVGGGLGPDLLMNVQMTVTSPLTYDNIAGARTIECGTSEFGDTLTATSDVGVAPNCDTTTGAPGVWYKFTDASGFPTEVALFTCSDDTDYDTKLSVYTGDPSDLICVVGNDDDCGLQSGVAFLSDGNSTFYILVHGWASSTGNFELTLECTLIPPPNDDIANAIDLMTVGCPFTDENVAMPAATNEAGTPAGCDINGANGVWYEFTPEINGFITGSISSPAGVSSVTFYTAPDQSSNETDLVHVDYYQNQCLPGTSATIPVIGGETYYCFVVNTGGGTDIVFDNCQLGTASNEIEGFVYSPNPTSERVNLASVQNIQTVVLYNILGQKLINLNVDATTTQLDVAHLAAGAYLMEVTVDGQKGVYKLIKQ